MEMKKISSGRLRGIGYDEKARRLAGTESSAPKKNPLDDLFS